MKQTMLLLLALSGANHLSAQMRVTDVIAAIRIDSTAIEAQHLRSATVFTDFTDYDEKGKSIVATRTRMEIDFNANGRRVYQRYNDISDRWFGFGSRTTTYESFDYDVNERTASHCYKDHWLSYCHHFTYNEEGNTTSVKTDGSTIANNTVSFEWQNGKMIRAKQVAVEGAPASESLYDSKGRLTEIRQKSGSRTTYEYTESETEEKRMIRVYLNGVQNETHVYTTLKATGQPTYYCRLNQQLDTLLEWSVRYDDQYNVVAAQESSFSERDPNLVPESSSPKEPPPRERLPNVRERNTTTYVIANTYENRLLTKRSIQLSRNGFRRTSEDLTERIVYDKKALPARIWPSEK